MGDVVIVNCVRGDLLLKSTFPTICTLLDSLLTIPVQYFYSHLLNTVLASYLHVCACVPYLRGLLTVPPEGEHVVPGGEVLGDLHLVHHAEQEGREAGHRQGTAKSKKSWGNSFLLT